MDNFRRMDSMSHVKTISETGNVVAISLMLICLIIMLGLQITLAVFFGKYAFNNPDRDGWYGRVGGVEMMDSQLAL